MLTYWKSSGIWQLKSGRRSDMPTCIQIVYFGHVKIQLVNGAVQIASVDIGIDQMSMLLCDCFLGNSRNQFEVRNIPTIEMNFDLVI